MHTCRVHIHDDKRSIFGDLYVSSEAWRALPLENGWDSYVMAPLIGQYSVSVTLLTNQLFVWVYLNSGPDLTKRVPSSDREREDLSIDVKHDSVQWNEKKNCGRSKMWSVMLSCTIHVLHNFLLVCKSLVVGYAYTTSTENHCTFVQLGVREINRAVHAYAFEFDLCLCTKFMREE